MYEFNHLHEVGVAKNLAIEYQGRMKSGRHFVPKQPIGLLSLLKEHFRKDEAQARELLALGAIYLNHDRLKSEQVIQPSDRLVIFPHPHRFPAEEVDWKSRVVLESEEFLVIDKPSGVPTHATVDNGKENALQAMRDTLGEELFVTHRLDTPVSGLLLFAKTVEYQKRFNQLLSQGRVKKFYEALVLRPVGVARYTHFVNPNGKGSAAVSLTRKPNHQESVLSVKACERAGGYFRLTIDLHTGRTHQIRAQLAALGAPVLGDRSYGGGKAVGFGRGIALRAVRLEWESHKQSCAPLQIKEGTPPTEESLISKSFT